MTKQLRTNLPAILFLALILVIAGYSFWQGVDMHGRASVEQAKFHELQTEYYSVALEDREAAGSNSPLSQKLVTIQNYPSELQRLEMVGIGRMLTGIFVLLFGVMVVLVVRPGAKDS